MRTSISTPTTLASVAPDDRPKSIVIAADLPGAFVVDLVRVDASDVVGLENRGIHSQTPFDCMATDP